jgi:MFS family permease
VTIREVERFRHNIKRYRVYQAVAFTPFFLPIIVLFWAENGLDPFDIYLLQGIFALAMVLLEVPTGMVADRLGKRASLIAAQTLTTVGMTVYALGRSFGVFLIAEIILALGIALVSGADSALLYDTLRRLGRQEEYRKIEGRARSLQMASFAVANIIGGLVGSGSYRAAMWLSVSGPVAGLFLALRFTEAGASAPGDRNGGANAVAGEQSYRALIGGSLRFVRKHRLVKWQIAFLAVLMGSSTWLLWLYQPYMKWSGLPVSAFGAAFAIFNLFAAGMSRLAHRFDRALGRTGTLAALSALQVAPLPLMALLVSPLSFLFILGHQAVRGISRVVISDRVLRYTYADKRATVLSLASLCGRLFFAFSAPLIGLVARQRAMSENLLFQAVLLFVILGGLLLAYRRIPEKYFTVKATVAERQ